MKIKIKRSTVDVVDGEVWAPLTLLNIPHEVNIGDYNIRKMGKKWNVSDVIKHNLLKSHKIVEAINVELNRYSLPALEYNTKITSYFRDGLMALVYETDLGQYIHVVGDTLYMASRTKMNDDVRKVSARNGRHIYDLSEVLDTLSGPKKEDVHQTMEKYGLNINLETVTKTDNIDVVKDLNEACEEPDVPIYEYIDSKVTLLHILSVNIVSEMNIDLNEIKQHNLSKETASYLEERIVSTYSDILRTRDKLNKLMKEMATIIQGESYDN